MSSHQQTYRAGEAKGQAEEKTGQAMHTMKGKAQGAKDEASEVAHSAHGAKESKDSTGSYLDAAKQKASETAQATRNKASQMAGYMKETAQSGKEKTGEILNKTGEHVKRMAQDAADAVKQNFGMAEQDEDEQNIYKTANRTHDLS